MLWVLATASSLGCTDGSNGSGGGGGEGPLGSVGGSGGAGFQVGVPTGGSEGPLGGSGSGIAGSGGGRDVLDGGGGGLARDAADGGMATADGGSIDSGALADCLAAMSEVATGDRTPYPGGRWTVPEPTYRTIIEYNVAIEMSDGVVLIGDVSYPADLVTGARAPGEFPVILTQNPYGAAFGAPYGEIFVTHGYIFASVDVRGTSRSGGGVHDLFSPREAEDGAELVAWAATLPGSDGNVGLQGCSQLGINQLETATQLGPDSPVKAMIPACPSGDFYRDTAFDNGVPSITAGFLVPDSAEGADTAYYREYWRERDRVARAPAIALADIPILLWSGWHEPGAVGSFELYTVLQNVSHGRPPAQRIAAGRQVSGKYQVIIGDWAHGGGLDLGVELQWYDTWIKGIDTGLPTDTETPLHLAELGGTERWVNARCYPLVDEQTPLYLASGGDLVGAADGDASSDQLQWVVQDLPADTVEYTSEPFVDGAMLAGPLAAELVVTSSNTNLQLFVEVFDRAPAGTLAKIGFGSIIGTLRGTDPVKSWWDARGRPQRPYLALDEDEPMTPGEPTTLDLPLGPTVWSIEPGHRIVVRVSTHPPSDACLGVLTPPVGCYPTQPMLDTLAGGIYELHLEGGHASFVSLPLLEHGALQTVDSVVSPTRNAATPIPIDW